VELSVARASADELEVALAIRRAVFVEEQGVPGELEADGRDASAEHFLARRGPRPRAVATARARRTDRGWKIERVAVLAAERGLGVGMELVRRVLELAPPGLVPYVHAQQGALGFWQRAGFIAEGPPFEEAGIPHRWMRLATPSGAR
jgi:predicted GNAT family N-acyltransferase